MLFKLTYKGKKLPVSIGFYALKQLQKETGKDFDPNNSQLESFEKLLFHSLVKGYERENKEMPFKRQDMEDILEDNFVNFAKMVNEAYADSSDMPKTKVGGGTVKITKK